MNQEKIQNNADPSDDLSIFADRISQIRLCFCNGINREFSQKTGIDEATTAKICSGTRGVGLRMLEKIAVAFPGVDARWLLTGIGDMLASGAQRVAEPSAEATIANLNDYIALLKEKVSRLEDELLKEKEKVASLSERMTLEPMSL